MSTSIEHMRMEANFEGLIQLLAQHLYPEPDVFVRELIQNAHDSIVRRRELELRAAWDAGRGAAACTGELGLLGR
jgi:HSP90 family molecular chaperone